MGCKAVWVVEMTTFDIVVALVVHDALIVAAFIGLYGWWVLK